MSQQTPADEVAFWSSVDLNDPRDLHGHPPYDATAVLRRFETLSPSPRRCLDLGCGIGRLANLYAEAHPDRTVIGVDISSHLLFEAAHGAPRNALYWRGDGRRIPDGVTGTFNLAWSVTMFQHIPPRAVVEYIWQVHDRLRPEGVFVFTIALGDGVPRPFDFTYAPDDLDFVAGWLADKFDSVEFEHDTERDWTWVACRK